MVSLRAGTSYVDLISIRDLDFHICSVEVLFDKEQTELSSWFQIAGIHGLPHVSWDNSPGGTEGYCQHGNDVFPTWHRPYVALLEVRCFVFGIG